MHASMPSPRRASRLAAALLAATLVATLVAGCTTVGPDYRLPRQAALNRPAAAQPFLGAAEPAFAAAPLPARWWRLYDDPALDGLIARAFAANTDLRVAAANLARARAVQQEVAGTADPVVGASAAPAYGRASAAAKGLREPLAAGYTIDAGIAVSYQLDLFGRIRRAVEAADADRDTAAAALDLVRVTVAADTARAYVDACGARHQLRIAQQSVALQQQTVDLTAKRIRAGRGTALDETRARAQLEQLRAALPPLLAQGRTAQFRLAALTGRAPAEMADAELACTAVPRLAAPLPVGDGAALLKRRPDVRQAERALAASTARIGVATADLYPGISLGLSAGSTGALDRFGAANAQRFSLGPLITWTLPTGSAHARVAEAEAGTAAALARFDGVVLNALRETESALAVYARELDRNAALRAAREQGALAAAQSRRMYGAGRIDFLALLDADRTLAASDSALAASDAQVAADQVALFLALGGGWEP